jgi:hypothetical protein
VSSGRREPPAKTEDERAGMGLDELNMTILFIFRLMDRDIPSVSHPKFRQISLGPSS